MDNTHAILYSMIHIITILYDSTCMSVNVMWSVCSHLLTNPDGLHHSSVPQLLQDLLFVEHLAALHIIGLDAPGGWGDTKRHPHCWCAPISVWCTAGSSVWCTAGSGVWCTVQLVLVCGVQLIRSCVWCTYSW